MEEGDRFDQHFAQGRSAIYDVPLNRRYRWCYSSGGDNQRRLPDDTSQIDLDVGTLHYRTESRCEWTHAGV
eukprot:scaffold27397_cov76-Skeletonema_dohrnii-CCMP3373.AAC.2